MHSSHGDIATWYLTFVCFHMAFECNQAFEKKITSSSLQYQTTNLRLMTLEWRVFSSSRILHYFPFLQRNSKSKREKKKTEVSGNGWRYLSLNVTTNKYIHPYIAYRRTLFFLLVSTTTALSLSLLGIRQPLTQCGGGRRGKGLFFFHDNGKWKDPRDDAAILSFGGVLCLIS